MGNRLGTVERREETVHVVFRGMKADVIPAIAGRNLVAITPYGMKNRCGFVARWWSPKCRKMEKP